MIGRIGGGPVRPTLGEIYQLVFLIFLQQANQLEAFVQLDKQPGYIYISR
ncbi:hypothetical protein BBR47_30160 [Brevibacillus brevis NBRC 100599]|uniref:Uncharacterized protein n=1 Tax=Brevibacillus brevis (strain 47 / JCM 6285 / NBRC 100599) TaxID=358681 RepID=C0ZDY4_BREBN|nr:hypothetical protein BBR47_30160 [Brevibacillus brevis NBRC 100599]